MIIFVDCPSGTVRRETILFYSTINMVNKELEKRNRGTIHGWVHENANIALINTPLKYKHLTI